MNEYLELHAKLEEEFSEQLVGVTRVKSGKAFQLAWQYGHADGASSVRNYFIDLISLIK